MMPNYIGIDFGTTRSTVVTYEFTNDSRNIKKNGEPILSIASIDKTTGSCYYGASAQDKIGEQYDYIPSLKDLLCKEFNKQYGTFNVTRDSILKGFFKHLKGTLGNDDNFEIVMAIPNDFPMERRCLLRSVAKSAGFEIKFFINEPMAAFFANYSHLTGYDSAAILRNCENVAIFDWGGGTLDVTVMQCTNGMVRELAKNRMDCAGNAIDERVALSVHQWISEAKGKNKSFEDMSLYAQCLMKQYVEEAKIKLNDPKNAEQQDDISILQYDDYGAVCQTITKEKFNESIEYIVDAAIDLLKKTIADSKLGVSGIDKILLVGGSSKLHLLQEKMKAEFGDKLLVSSGDSDWGVAIGAALLSATPGEFMVNQDVSLRLSDDSSYPLINKGKWTNEYSKGNVFEFGKVDSSSNAIFVFSGSADIDESDKKYLVIKTQALFDERLRLTVFIDENMIVHINGDCVGLPNSTSEWIYSNLSCCYQLPQG